MRGAQNHFLLGDRARRWLLPLLALALAASWYDFGHLVDSRQPRYREGTGAGDEVTAGYAVVESVSRDGLVVRDDEILVPVAGRIPGAGEGSVVSFRGTVRRDGRVSVGEAELHSGRRIKVWLSVAVVLGVAVLAARELPVLLGRGDA